MIRGKEGKRSINTTNERWRSQVALSVKSGDRRNTYIYIYISTKEFPLPPLSRIFEKILVVYYFLNPKDTTVRRASVLMNFPPPPLRVNRFDRKTLEGDQWKEESSFEPCFELCLGVSVIGKEVWMKFRRDPWRANATKRKKSCGIFDEAALTCCKSKSYPFFFFFEKKAMRKGGHRLKINNHFPGGASSPLPFNTALPLWPRILCASKCIRQTMERRNDDINAKEGIWDRDETGLKSRFSSSHKWWIDGKFAMGTREVK